MSKWYTRKLFAEIAKKFASYESEVDMDDFAWYVDEDTSEYYRMRFDYDDTQYTITFFKKSKEVTWEERREELR